MNVPKWEMEVLTAQARAFKPDVIFICDVLYLPAHFHQTLKEYTKLLVGEMAYPIPPGLDLGPFDLVISAAPHFVDRLRRAGARSELLRLGFEKTILDRLGTQTKDVELAFIGSVGKDHQQRLELLEELSRKVPISFWGAGADSLPADSPLRGRVKPPLWGYDMYRQLQRSKIALNIHIDMAEQFAANMRLYEATGVGTMLLTDWKTNLHELFEIGKEVVAYRSTEECVDLVNYYLEHESERETIAKAGQQRTLCEHSYYHRMQELTEILNRYLLTR
jgi:spore maturation protein CgeB